MERKDVCVVTNLIKVQAKNKGRISDGFDSLVWLLKKAGGRMHYGDVLRDIKNPWKFNKRFVEFMHERQRQREVRKNG